ncbi:MAG TPA: MFS transporter [Bacteroidales bacterium]|nr:MFS transporter [Bacteroidales bacterium]
MKKTLIPMRFVLLFCTFLMSVLLYVDRASISAAKNDICADLHIGITEFGWIMAVFTLGYALFQTPSGKLADKAGPRVVITFIVAAWSFLTSLTGLVRSYSSMLLVRFLFGGAEAGAFPALSKVVFNWFPHKERGIAQGINFSGSRIGAAFAMPLVAWMITTSGWRNTFLVIGLIGFIYSALWYLLFRNKPEDSGFISNEEMTYITGNRQQEEKAERRLSFINLMASSTVWKLMIQYICSNFTFYFTITWMYTYILDRFGLGAVETGLYASVPLIAGAAGNWFGGILVDYIFRKGNWKLSRRIPAVAGFIVSASGMILVTFADSPAISVLYMSLAVFGADMTLSPSWAFCIDAGKQDAGLVSGTMNMAGNLGAFITIITFPYVFTLTKSYEPFFLICAALSIVAVFMWLALDPKTVISPNNTFS